jgi:hypothetical protein
MGIMLLDEKKSIETLKYPTPISSPENSPDKFQKDVSVANSSGESSKYSTSLLDIVTIQDLE